MKINFSYARGAGKCSFCPNPILVGEPVVVGRTPVSAGRKNFYSKRRWHPQCYLDQGLRYLDLHPFTPEVKGRPRLPALPTGDKLRRLSILRRHATTLQRIRNELSKVEPNFNTLAHLGERIELLRDEISSYGGAPKSWWPKEVMTDDTSNGVMSDDTCYQPEMPEV